MIQRAETAEFSGRPLLIDIYRPGVNVLNLKQVSKDGFTRLFICRGEGSLSLTG